MKKEEVKTVEQFIDYAKAVEESLSCESWREPACVSLLRTVLNRVHSIVYFGHRWDVSFLKGAFDRCFFNYEDDYGDLLFKGIGESYRYGDGYYSDMCVWWKVPNLQNAFTEYVSA